MADEFLTVAEVAALLKVNQQTVRNCVIKPDGSRLLARAAGDPLA
jgi:hypothetical protein